MSEPVYVGIDVAKRTFEVAATGQAQTFSLGNDEAGHAQLCQLLAPLSPRLVLLDPTPPPIPPWPSGGRGGRRAWCCWSPPAAPSRTWSLLCPRQACVCR